MTCGTSRLVLLPLTEAQLRDLLRSEGPLPLAPEIFDSNVLRAIDRKLEKMAVRPVGEHPWLTYWLIRERATGLGVGFVGFKGAPDAQRASEIGYGLAPSARGKGYATEAVGALCTWAFTHPELETVTATTVTNPNSERVLLKLGAELVSRTDNSTNWVLRRDALTHSGPR